MAGGRMGGCGSGSGRAGNDMSSAESMWLFGIREFIAAATGLAGGLALEVDGELVEVGGVGEESVTLTSRNGITILADLDGDGIVDHVAAHDYSGGFEVWSRATQESGWGIPGGMTEKPSGDWGLESEITPVKGHGAPSGDTGRGQWICVDRG